MQVKSQSEVVQSCLTPSDPMDWSLPGSSVHGIFQARVLEWSAIALSGSYSIEQPLRTFFKNTLKVIKGIQMLQQINRSETEKTIYCMTSLTKCID